MAGGLGRDVGGRTLPQVSGGAGGNLLLLLAHFLVQLSLLHLRLFRLDRFHVVTKGQLGEVLILALCR